MDDKLAWGIIGPGGIAGRFASELPRSTTGRLYAVASRDADKAREFAEKHGAAVSYGSYAQLLADPEVDAVYIATPHTEHAQWAIKAAEAGKHVLCEKPIAPNHAEAMAVLEAARHNDVCLLEAYMYRFASQTRKLVELITDRTIGEVRQIHASFSGGGPGLGTGRNWDPWLAGGGILDLGGYPVTMARLLAGAATGQRYAEPDRVDASGRVGETGVDEWTVASIYFPGPGAARQGSRPGGISAHLIAGIRMGVGSEVTVYGSEGLIQVPNPWLPGRDGSASTITVRRVGEPDEQITVEPVPMYAAEADAFAAHLGDRQVPEMDWGDTAGTMKVLDSWRAAIGLEYPFEWIDAKVPTVSREPLRVRPDHQMRYGSIPGVDKQVSRLVMGVDNQTTLPHGSAMFDDFVQRGGNTFDTAYIYGGGRCERVLGQWMANRGIRDDLVLIGKGAHPPHVGPDAVEWQLTESLERLQTDHLDVYFLHRDDPTIPVGEWVDAMDAQVRAGRIRVYGGSNWSLDRVAEANAYARANGRQTFVAVSNNLSLARMLQPVWAGCMAVSDDESRSWLERQAAEGDPIAVLPWSSQARGFFTERADPADKSDRELVRCWYSDENFERQRRARELAAERGVAATAVALAYVLHQRYPTFPLIGPRAISETVSSFDALSVELTAEEVAYLDLRTPA